MRDNREQPLWSKILSIVLTLVLIVLGVGLIYGYILFQKLTGFGGKGNTTTTTSNSDKGALTIHVPEDAKTLSEALTQADDGDTIVLAAGTYSDPITDNGLSVGMGIHKALTIQGAGRGKTILDGKQKAQHGVYIPQVDKTIVVKDMTVQNYTENGAEVFGKNVTLSGMSFLNNGRSGAAFHLVSRDTVFKNNIVAGNKFNGVSTEKSPVKIFNNTFEKNGLVGIYIVVADDDPVSSSPTVYNNIIGHHTSAGVLYESPAHVESVVVDHNNAYSNQHNYFQDLNNDKTKTKTANPVPGTGNVSVDPHYIDSIGYQLPDGSSLKTAGRSGVELGAYGGIIQ